MISRAKVSFWILSGLALFFLCVPTVILVQSLEDYAHSLSYWKLGNLKPSSPQSPASPSLTTRPPSQTKLYFVKFRYEGKSKRVYLGGDFNRWNAQDYPLSKKGRSWEISLPLPPGRYRYLFYADGQWFLDPKNPEVAEENDFKASLKHIP